MSRDGQPAEEEKEQGGGDGPEQDDSSPSTSASPQVHSSLRLIQPKSS